MLATFNFIIYVASLHSILKYQSNSDSEYYYFYDQNVYFRGLLPSHSALKLIMWDFVSHMVRDGIWKTWILPNDDPCQIGDHRECVSTYLNVFSSSHFEHELKVLNCTKTIQVHGIWRRIYCGFCLKDVHVLYWTWFLEKLHHGFMLVQMERKA